MNQKTFKKVFTSLAVSQIFALLCGTIANTIDTSVTGQFIGGDAVAALGYCFPAIFVYIALGTLVSFGSQLQCSKYIGEGRMDKARTQFTITMILLAVVALALVAVFCGFSKELAALLGAEGEHMISLTAEYLVAVSFGILPIYIMLYMTQICNIDGNATTPIYSVIVLIICDIAFDLINAVVIKGGLFGMGIASSLAYVFCAAVIITHLFSKKCTFKFTLKGVETSMLTRPLVGGLPSFIQSMGLAGVSVIINYLLTDGENVNAVAAFSVGYCVLYIFLSISNGLAPSILTFGGIFYGDEDRHSMGLLQKQMLKVSILWNAVAFAVVWALTLPLARLFTDEEAIVEICKTAIPLLCTQMIFYCLDSCFQNYMLAIGKEKLIIVISFLSNFVLCGASAFVLKALFGTTGVWLCYTAGKFLSCLVLLAYVAIKNKGIPKKADDWLLLPESFEAGKLAGGTYEVRSLEDAKEASEKVWNFCTENGADRRTRFILSLFVEEMGTNAVAHGFDEKKKNQLDISISAYKDFWKIRLRDDGKLFDPINYLKLHNHEDPERCIGIKMATGMADDIQYLNTFNLNNMVITIKR